MTDAQLLLKILLNNLRQAVDAADEAFDTTGAKRLSMYVPVDEDGNEVKSGTIAAVGASLRGSFKEVEDPNGRPLALLPLDDLIAEWEGYLDFLKMSEDGTK